MPVQYTVTFNTDKFDEALERLKKFTNESTRDNVRVWCSRNYDAMYIVSDPVVVDGGATIELLPTARFKNFISSLEAASR